MPPQQTPPITNANVPQAVPALPVSERSFPTLFVAAGIAFVLVIGGLVYWFGGASETPASEPKKIGILSFRQFNDVARALKEEIPRLGYTNVTYDEALAVPGPTMMQDIDREVRRMVAEDVDAIWASLEMQAKAAVDITKELGRTDIPIVFMTRFHDPIEYGIIQSFRSSGNNSTGVATNLLEIVQRNLEFLKEINPSIKKVGVFSDGYMVTDIGGEYFKALKQEAPRFGMEVIEYKTSVPPPQAEAEFNRVAATIKKGDLDALFHIGGHFYNTQEKGESKLAIRLGIPMVAPYEDLPNGGIFSYSDDFGESGKASAALLDKIFKGTKPADIPIEYGAKNILTLMLGRAREAGVVFPEAMLFIAKNKFEDDSAFEVESLVHE